MSKTEIWKDIKGFEGRYQVSNLGRVRSLDMVLEGKNWKSSYPFEYQRSGKVLKPLKKRNGYYHICLRNNGKPKFFVIHRLVALAFIPNPNKLPCVNHKDEDKANNVVSNLEWCTQKYNSNYGTRNERLREYSINNVMRPVVQYDMEGKVIDTFESLSDAANKTGIPSVDISGVCNGRRKTTHGYVFKFLNHDTPKRKMSKGYNNPFIRHAETLRKKIVQYDLSGQIVDTFDSITEACNKTGISSWCIHGTLSGKRPHTHGYVFKFKDDS
jgi:hypothetical protein